MTPRGALSAKLLGLLSLIGAGTVAGVAVVVYTPADEATPNAVLVDAGIKVDANPKWLSCWVCGSVCDGGGCCQKRIPAAVAKTLPADGGDREVIFAGKAQVREFRRLVAQFGEASACRSVAATWPEIADFLQDPSDDVPPCACQRRGGPPCLYRDGGPIGSTVLTTETIDGGGCVARLCGGPAGADPVPPECDP